MSIQPQREQGVTYLQVAAITGYITGTTIMK